MDNVKCAKELLKMARSLVADVQTKKYLVTNENEKTCSVVASVLLADVMSSTVTRCVTRMREVEAEVNKKYDEFIAECKANGIEFKELHNSVVVSYGELYAEQYRTISFVGNWNADFIWNTAIKLGLNVSKQ